MVGALRVDWGHPGTPKLLGGLPLRYAWRQADPALEGAWSAAGGRGAAAAP